MVVGIAVIVHLRENRDLRALCIGLDQSHPLQVRTRRHGDRDDHRIAGSLDKNGRRYLERPAKRRGVISGFRHSGNSSPAAHQQSDRHRTTDHDPSGADDGDRGAALRYAVGGKQEHQSVLPWFGWRPPPIPKQRFYREETSLPGLTWMAIMVVRRHPVAVYPALQNGVFRNPCG